MNKKILKKLQEFIQKNKTITPRQFKLISEGKTPKESAWHKLARKARMFENFEGKLTEIGLKFSPL